MLNGKIVFLCFLVLLQVVVGLQTVLLVRDLARDLVQHLVQALLR